LEDEVMTSSGGRAKKIAGEEVERKGVKTRATAAVADHIEWT